MPLVWRSELLEPQREGPRVMRLFPQLQAPSYWAANLMKRCSKVSPF